jgi:hypothetical protein
MFSFVFEIRNGLGKAKSDHIKRFTIYINPSASDIQVKRFKQNRTLGIFLKKIFQTKLYSRYFFKENFSNIIAL